MTDPQHTSLNPAAPIHPPQNAQYHPYLPARPHPPPPKYRSPAIMTRGESISLARRAAATAKKRREEARAELERRGVGDGVDAALAGIIGASASTRSNVSQNKAKRQKRVKWTPQEVEALRTGVSQYGEGRWAVILREYASSFNPVRISVDLKDKWRNLYKVSKNIPLQTVQPVNTTVVTPASVNVPPAHDGPGRPLSRRVDNEIARGAAMMAQGAAEMERVAHIGRNQQFAKEDHRPQRSEQHHPAGETVAAVAQHVQDDQDRGIHQQQVQHSTEMPQPPQTMTHQPHEENHHHAIMRPDSQIHSEHHQPLQPSQQVQHPDQLHPDQDVHAHEQIHTERQMQADQQLQTRQHLQTQQESEETAHEVHADHMQAAQMKAVQQIQVEEHIQSEQQMQMEQHIRVEQHILVEQHMHQQIHPEPTPQADQHLQGGQHLSSEQQLQAEQHVPSGHQMHTVQQLEGEQQMEGQQQLSAEQQYQESREIHAVQHLPSEDQMHAETHLRTGQEVQSEQPLQMEHRSSTDDPQRLHETVPIQPMPVQQHLEPGRRMQSEQDVGDEHHVLVSEGHHVHEQNQLQERENESTAQPQPLVRTGEIDNNTSAVHHDEHEQQELPQEPLHDHHVEQVHPGHHEPLQEGTQAAPEHLYREQHDGSNLPEQELQPERYQGDSDGGMTSTVDTVQQHVEHQVSQSNEQLVGQDEMNQGEVAIQGQSHDGRTSSQYHEGNQDAEMVTSGAMHPSGHAVEYEHHPESDIQTLAEQAVHARDHQQLNPELQMTQNSQEADVLRDAQGHYVAVEARHDAVQYGSSNVGDEAEQSVAHTGGGDEQRFDTDGAAQEYEVQTHDAEGTATQRDPLQEEMHEEGEGEQQSGIQDTAAIEVSGDTHLGSSQAVESIREQELEQTRVSGKDMDGNGHPGHIVEDAGMETALLELQSGGGRLNAELQMEVVNNREQQVVVQAPQFIEVGASLDENDGMHGSEMVSRRDLDNVDAGDESHLDGGKEMDLAPSNEGGDGEGDSERAEAVAGEAKAQTVLGMREEMGRMGELAGGSLKAAELAQR